MDSLVEQVQVAEIGSVEIGLDIPIAADRVAAIKEQDDDPMFVTIEIEEGMSQSKRKWSGSILRGIADQVNDKLPVGYKGHISPEDDPYAFPDPQVCWLGAKADVQNGKTVVRAKGYVLNSEAKRMIKLGAINSFSVRGNAIQTPSSDGSVEIKEFDLESIDFARKGRAGMKSRIVAVTSEMEGGNEVEPKEISALTLDDLRQNNPLLVEKIETEARKDLETKVAEQKTALDDAEEKDTLLASIRTKLGLGEDGDVLENLSAIMERVEGAVRTEVRNFIKEKVADKVKSEGGQKLVLRMVGEMTDVQAQVDDDGHLTADTQKEIETKLDDAFENDEDVKAVVSEQIVTVSTGGANLGSRRTGKSEQGGTSRLKVEEVPLGG